MDSIKNGKGLALLFLLSFGANIGPSDGNCNFMDPMMGRWWVSNYQGRNTIVRLGTGEEVIEYVYTDGRPSTDAIRHTCESYGFNTYVRTNVQPANNLKTCVNTYIPDITYPHLAIQREFELSVNQAANPNVDYLYCFQNPALYVTPYDILMKWPFQYGDSACNLPKGTFLAKVNTGTGQNLCDGDKFSSIHTTDKQVQIRTCGSGSSLLQNTFDCVAKLDPSDIGDMSTSASLVRGYALILAQTQTDGSVKFYCARVRLEQNGEILMSIGIEDSTAGVQALCHPDASYLQTQNIGTTSFISYSMTPKSCSRPSPLPPLCENSATCIPIGFDVFCSCAAGFSGEFCEININDCPTSLCQQPNGQCVDKVNDYACNCNPGYGGINCDVVLDFCSPDPCRSHGTCSNDFFGNTFTCACYNGYVGLTCDTFMYCSTNPCQNSGVCVERLNAYECICPPGFSGDNCQFQAACSSNPCNNAGTCVGVTGGYECRCVLGWAGLHCERVAPCATNPCVNGGQCYVNPAEDTYMCSCPYGYTGRNCEQVMHCANYPCKNGGSCQEHSNGFTCECGYGFTGTTCESRLACVSQPCLNGGTCNEYFFDFSCTCLPGYVGSRCEIDSRTPPTTPTTTTTTPRDPCSNHFCRNGATCDRTSTNSYTCRCFFGYEGEYCEKSVCKPDSCSNGGICEPFNNYQKYICKCPDGTSQLNCASPCSNNSCENGATCREYEDAASGYVCLCKPGFGGPFCQLSGGCNPDPCMNGAYCRNKESDYECDCRDGWSGKRCDEEAFNMTVLIIVLVCLLVLVFVILIILVCVCCCMRKNKRTEEEDCPPPAAPTPVPIIVKQVPQQQPPVKVITVTRSNPNPVVAQPMVIRQAPVQRPVVIAAQAPQVPSVQTSALFVSDDPRRIYQVPDPQHYQYPPEYDDGMYSLPKPKNSILRNSNVQYVAELEPMASTVPQTKQMYDAAGLPVSDTVVANSRRGSIAASIHSTVDPNDYLANGRQANGMSTPY